MRPYSARRAADIRLRDNARAIGRRARRFTRKRWACRATVLAFGLRVRLKWHDPPNRNTKAMSLGFRYGRYGGVGHGIPAGEWRPAVDDLDAEYLEHDKTYASNKQLARRRTTQERRALAAGVLP